MMGTHLQRSDLESIFTQHSGNRLFARALQKVSQPADLLRVLGRYIYFNSPFGGGVASLAGQIATRQELFRDAAEPVFALADRSGEVAANIFCAAVDEFGDRSTSNRDVHRALAQATLKATGDFFAMTGDKFQETVCPDAVTLQATEKVKQGYGVGLALDERGIFRAIGFHAGSEMLADEEFRLLDGYLRSHQPQLVAYLEQAEVKIGDSLRPAYVWIHIHTSVEADHFHYAAQGAEVALRYYAGAQDASTAKGWILEGFQQFADLQTEEMQGLRNA